MKTTFSILAFLICVFYGYSQTAAEKSALKTIDQQLVKCFDDQNWFAYRNDKDLIRKNKAIQKKMGILLKNPLTLKYPLDSFSTRVPSILSSDGKVRIWKYELPMGALTGPFLETMTQWQDSKGNIQVSGNYSHLKRGTGIGSRMYFSLQKQNLNGRHVYFLFGRDASSVKVDREVLEVFEIKDSGFRSLNQELGLPFNFYGYPSTIYPIGFSPINGFPEKDSTYHEKSRLHFDSDSLILTVPATMPDFQVPRKEERFRFVNGKFLKEN